MGHKTLVENKKHVKLLRFIGVTLLSIGIICFIIAGIDFFSGDFPTKFYLFFIGGPFIFVGLVMSSYGYMGSVARYSATQIAPVSKDTFNYLVDGTKDSITDLASGIIKEVNNKNQSKSNDYCPSCNALVEDDAKFCFSCGKSLSQTCPSCNASNPAHAKFCGSCGHRF